MIDHAACLRALASLPAVTGWLDGDAVAIDPRAVASARTCVDILAATGAPLPYVFPTPEGGVQLEWDAATQPDVRIAPDGAVVLPEMTP